MWQNIVSHIFSKLKIVSHYFLNAEIVTHNVQRSPRARPKIQVGAMGGQRQRGGLGARVPGQTLVVSAPVWDGGVAVGGGLGREARQMYLCWTLKLDTKVGHSGWTLKLDTSVGH